jgi:hypothetical protein
MALENRTIAEINQLIIDQIETQTGQIIPILPKAFIRILAKVLAGVFIILYKVAGWIFLQIFVSTASYDEVEILGKKITPLIEWGRLVSVGDPDPATQAELSIDLTVLTLDSVLPSGTQFTSDLNGLTYITQQSYTLSIDPFTIDVICTKSGTIGNLEVNDILTIANSVGYIEDDAPISAILTTAVDKEAEDDYRQRIIERFQLQPQGGALTDYRIWAQDASGVKQSYWYTGDPSNVIGYIEGDPEIYPDRIPDSSLLLAVGNVIDFDPDTGLATRRPVTAVIDPVGDKTYTNIKAVILKEFDVEITGLVIDNIDDIEDQIYDALVTYFLNREPFIEGLTLLPKRNVVSQANVIGIVDDIVSANNGTFTTAIIELGGFITAQYTLGEGEISKLKSLTVNGSLYVP